MPSFTLAQIGLDHAEQALCTTVLTLAGGIEIAQWRQVAQPDLATLVIISGERQTTLDAILTARGNHSLPLVAELSTGSAASHSEALHIKRPLTYAAVVALLKEAENRLGGAARSVEDWTRHFLHPATTLEAASSTRQVAPPTLDSHSDKPALPTEEAVPEEEVPEEEVPEEEVPEEEVPEEEVPEEEAPEEEAPEEEAPLEASPTLLSEVAINTSQLLDSPPTKPDTATERNNVALADSAAAPYSRDNDTATLSKTSVAKDERMVDTSALPTDTLVPQTETPPATPAEKTRLAQVIPLPVTINGNNHSKPNTPFKESPKPQTGKGGDEVPATPSDLFRPARRFVPKLRLLGLIQDIVANGGSYRISRPGFPDILLWPQAGLFQCDTDIATMPEIFRQAWSEFSVDASRKQPPPQFVNTSQPLIRLRYLAALHGSEGRLMLGVNAQATLKLKSLPDFDLLDCTPEQQRLARHLHDYPATLGELATVTQTAIATVIDFTNACREIGLIEASHQPPTSGAKAPRHRGLLHRLRRSWQRLHHKPEETL